MFGKQSTLMQLAWRRAEVAGHIKTKTTAAAGGGCDVTVSGTVEQTMRMYTAKAKLFLQDICYENRAPAGPTGRREKLCWRPTLSGYCSVSRGDPYLAHVVALFDACCVSLQRTAFHKVFNYCSIKPDGNGYMIASPIKMMLAC